MCGNVANREYSRLAIAAYSRVKYTTSPFRKGGWEVFKSGPGGKASETEVCLVRVISNGLHPPTSFR